MHRPPNRVIQATRGIDKGRAFVGGPTPGDLSNVGIIIPIEPTNTYQTRYMFRLATVRVQPAHRFWVTGVRQLLTIAAHIPIRREQAPVQADPTHLLMERQVVTPMWAFPDGNVSWHLRVVPPGAGLAYVPTAFRQGWSPDVYGDEPAILYVRLENQAIAPFQYIPPGNGIPPGEPVSTYGHMNDLRDPWYRGPSTSALKIEVLGPCSIILYASVWQTDPRFRPVPDYGIGPEQFTTLEGLEPEDQFWIPYASSARYHRIGGEISGEMEPLEETHSLEACRPRCG